MATQQVGLEFPQPLAEKYRPRQFADFVGLDKAKKIMGKLASNPFPSAWLFVGPSGTGKTTMALTLAEVMPAELHHIASKDCTLAEVDSVCYQCHFAPRMFNDWTPAKMHLVLVDEADQMSPAAQIAFLSKLDATAFPPSTIFIFTCNATDRLEARFLSRTHVIEFSSYGISDQVVQLLETIWDKEFAGNPRPNLRRLVKDSANNVRDALMNLETEGMAV